MPVVLQGGAADGRRPGPGGRVVGALLVTLLAGAAVWQVVDRPGDPAAPHAAAGGPVPPTAQPSTQAPSSAPVVTLPVPTARPARSLPWSRFATGAGTPVDVAAGRHVVVSGRTRDLGAGSRVLTMVRAAGGPVLLVQRPGALSLEQLRPGGVRFVLDTFPGERRLPQGVAVDPAGRQVAYALTSVVPGSSSIVVRDLATGAATVRLQTHEPFAVSDWTRAGVVLQVAKDPGAPPYLWAPSPDRPRRLLPFAHGSSGPFLLASAPGRAAWLVTRPEPACTDLAAGVPTVIVRSACGIPLSDPAAWSPGGGLVAARGGDGRLRLLDVGRMTVTRLRSGRAELRQVVWSPRHTVLAVVVDRPGEHGALLDCYLGGQCQRVPLPAGFGAADLVLAR